jgi:hypothetical protein
LPPLYSPGHRLPERTGCGSLERGIALWRLSTIGLGATIGAGTSAPAQPVGPRRGGHGRSEQELRQRGR